MNRTRLRICNITRHCLQDRHLRRSTGTIALGIDLFELQRSLLLLVIIIGQEIQSKVPPKSLGWFYESVQHAVTPLLDFGYGRSKFKQEVTLCYLAGSDYI